MKKIQATEKELKKFGITFAIIFAIIGSYLLYKNSDNYKWFAIVSGLFLLSGLTIPKILKPIYKGWMLFAFALGWFNARLLLGIMFYLVFTPVGFIMKLLRKELLDLKIDKNATTYWKKREHIPFDKSRYEHLF
jgi:hypothetical protein